MRKTGGEQKKSEEGWKLMFLKVKTTGGGRENYARKRDEDGKLSDKTRKRSFKFFNEIIISSSRYESAG